MQTREDLIGLRVLIVDDNKTNREILHNQVIAWGMHNGSAESGWQALEMLRTAATRGEAYDLVLLDWHMPEMDGFEAASEIRRREQAEGEDCPVPIIALTANVQKGVQEQCCTAGMDSYLSKPFTQDQLRAVAVGEQADLNHRIVHTDGTERHICQQVEAVFGDDGEVTHLYGTMQDITELRQAEERIHRLAYFDSLTGLPNREFFKESIEQIVAIAARHNRKGVLLFLDLDNFKRVNDTLGHDIGDLLLKATAERLVEGLRASDIVTRNGLGEERYKLARLGGDEFTVVLPEIERAEDAAKVARRILKALAQPMRLSGHDVVITPSIGITVFPEDSDQVDSLLKNGDMAMYYAKREGRNTFKFYDDAMNEAAFKRLALEGELRRALDRGEFSVHYQP